MRSWLPNALSLTRVGLAVLVLLLSARLTATTFTVTLLAIVLALITDGLDGHLARRWNTKSELGYVLDTMGDRAIHLALILVFVVRYHVHPIFAWLLIFRDIGIYAVRVLSRDWLAKSLAMRPVSLLHSVTLRLWLLLFLLRDGARVVAGSDVFDTDLFNVVQLSLLSFSLITSYYGLYRSFEWLVERDQPSLDEKPTS